MAGKKLDEELKKVEAEEVKAKLAAASDKLKEQKKAYHRLRLRQLGRDVFYVLIMSFLLGFSWWAWTDEISFLKSLSFGVLWYLLFEELQLQDMFKREVK